MTERLAGSVVELVTSPRTDTPPPEEAARLRSDLARLYPIEEAHKTLRVVLSWSAPDGAWQLGAASQHIARVAWADRAQQVAQRLEAAGHQVRVRPRKGPHRQD